jgi:hypothetical protein
MKALVRTQRCGSMIDGNQGVLFLELNNIHAIHRRNGRGLETTKERLMFIKYYISNKPRARIQLVVAARLQP